MPLNTIPLPFGARDLKVRSLTGETPGTSVDLPNFRTLSFSETESFEDLRGDDGLAASHGSGPSVDWQLENGGISFEAVAVMYGGQVSTTGVSPNQVKTYTKLDTDSRPYFQIEGQAISDSGGDLHVVLDRCKATGDLQGEMGEGAFWLTGSSGKAYARASDRRLWRWLQNETTTAIT